MPDMSRSLPAIAGLLICAALAAPAGAKDENWAQICGRNGCKILKDRLVTAALTGEAEEQGSKVRSSRTPAYTVRYVARTGKPFGPTYWLTTDAIDYTIRSSQPSVSRLFARAIAGVQPLSTTNGHHRSPWRRFIVLGSAVAVSVLVGAVLYRRRESMATPARL
jgi:hypothetical protein